MIQSQGGISALHITLPVGGLHILINMKAAPANWNDVIKGRSHPGIMPPKLTVNQCVAQVANPLIALKHGQVTDIVTFLHDRPSLGGIVAPAHDYIEALMILPLYHTFSSLLQSNKLVPMLRYEEQQFRGLKRAPKNHGGQPLFRNL